MYSAAQIAVALYSRCKAPSVGDQRKPCCLRRLLVLSFGSVGKTSCSRLISPFWMNDQASLRDTSPLHGSAGLYVSPERERKYTTNEFGRKIDTCVIAKLSGDAPTGSRRIRS